MLLKLLLASVLLYSVVGQRDPLLPFLTSGSCNVDKQCIRLPHDKCDFDTCDTLFTWKAGSLSGQQVIVYELTGTTLSYSQSSAYLAAIFSADQVRGNDYIVACGWDGSSEFVRFAYQAGDTGKLTIFTEPDRGYTFVRSPDVHFNPENGRISCTFAIQRDRPANKLLPKLSNGASLSYFFFTGIEAYLADFPALGSPPKNSYGPYYISPSEAALTSDEWHARPRRSPSVAHRAHGILMLISWMWLASIAIVTARYMKTTFGVARGDAATRNVKSTYLDGRTWYQVHRALQITAVALSVISFVLLFIVEGKWVGSDYPFLPEFAHPILGCIVMALALLNFVLGWCAPRNLTRERCVWNWFHWLIGSATHCIALPTIFIGMSMKSWAWYLPVILFIWIIFHVLVEILLEIIACCGACACCFNRSKRSDGAVAVSLRDDEEKKDPNSKESKALVFQNADGRRVVMQDKQSSCACPVGSTCRMIIWSIHVCVTSIVAIVLCFLLALTG